MNILKRFSFLSFTIFLLLTPLFSNGNNGSVRDIQNYGLSGLKVSWNFAAYTSNTVTVEGESYQFIRIKDFTHTKEVGKAAMPTTNELMAIPSGAVVKIEILKSEYIDIPINTIIHPALQPATDTYGAPEPQFEIDKDFYSTDQLYPANVVELESTHSVREIVFGVFNINPIQYNPVQGFIRVWQKLEYEVQFSNGSSFLDPSMHSSHFLEMVPGWFLNGSSLQNEIGTFNQTAAVPASPNYIIVTHSDYLAAAQKLADWKQQLGYKVELLSGNSWTESSVSTEVASRYNSWTPKPDFLLIIGDYPDVPGRVTTGNYGTYSTDLYYVCMGGANDFVADMARGRISVSTATEALNVVDKIIQYEKNPTEDSTFYSTGVHAAYFQHKGSGYAERRFAQTSEEILQYQVNTQGYDITRVYYTPSSVTPTNWNNTLYSAGEPIPNHLKKPGFPWTGNAANINSALNSGAFYILHRDHGLETGWGDPAYNMANISALNNGNKTPIVFTINCLTGKYYYGECFAERFLRKYPGGAVGVFGHAEVSLSGYNDALAFGLFDAIFASPGCIPNFTGTGGINLANPGTHPKMFCMGDVANHALIRMTQTWGTHQYTNELLHYFGDPAMRIFTRKPVPVAAFHSGSINCSVDTSLTISSPNCSSGIATLIVDGELVSMNQLNGGYAVMSFPKLSGNYALLTISDTNMVPFVDTIIITGGCPKAKFSHQASIYCLSNPITFTSQSSGTISTYQWNFGQGAVPATATGQGPHIVNYTTSGHKTVTLIVSGTASHSVTETFQMDSLCVFSVPKTGNYIIDMCDGELTDDGGDLNYSNSSNGSVTITPPGASSVHLLFSSFNFENNRDFLKIYNGPNTSSPLIGSYTGTSLPGGNGMISSTTGSITIQQVTDASNNQSGFKLTFQCAYPNSAPLSNFIVSDSNICTGEYHFTDLSFNGPTSWLWDFGDGTTSTVQNPQHQYQYNSNFTVKLITTNNFGSDTLVKSGFVKVNLPLPPLAYDNIRCKGGYVQLTATAGGVLNWYTSPTGVTPVHTGANFKTPYLNQTTTYFVENVINPPSMKGGKVDNSGGGSYLTTEHYLIFNAEKSFVLKSVLVYAQTAGNRTIALRNSSGTTIKTATVSIPAGSSRVTLDFEVPQANNLRLVCTGSPNLYRNNGGLNYPYTIPGLLSIHSTSASTPTGYYYYFYDWEVQEPSCASPRVQVQAIISDSIQPQAAFAYSVNTNQVKFTNQSKYADSYIWNFGDGSTGTQIDPSHVYQTPGNYFVGLQADNQCGSDLAGKQIVVLTTIDEVYEGSAIEVFPNPAIDKVFIKLYLSQPKHISLRISDLSGRIIRDISQVGVEGDNLFEVELRGISQGSYLLSIDEGSRLIRKKIILKP